jgi:hypothetical protein
MMNQTEAAWYCLFFCWQFLSHALAHYKDVRAFRKIMMSTFTVQSTKHGGTLFFERITNHSEENHQ